MTIDVCTRTWVGASLWDGVGEAARRSVRWPRPMLAPNPSSHAMAMECVDGAFVLGYRCERMGVCISGEQIREWMKDAPSGVFIFEGIDPLSERAMETLERARDAGAAGITIAPADCGCRPTHERMMSVFEWCAARGMPVVISNPALQTSESVLEYANSALLDEAARSYPGLRLVLGDVGAAYVDEALTMLGKHEHVFAEIGTAVRGMVTLARLLLCAHERGVMDKLMFASGFPWCAPAEAIERIYKINGVAVQSGLPVVPREALRQMIERDVLPLLGIGKSSKDAWRSTAGSEAGAARDRSLMGARSA